MFSCYKASFDLNKEGGKNPNPKFGITSLCKWWIKGLGVWWLTYIYIYIVEEGGNNGGNRMHLAGAPLAIIIYKEGFYFF